MLTPKGRGELSELLFGALRSEAPDWIGALTTAPSNDGDAQICLWALYELHYRGLEDVPDEFEWQPELLDLRWRLETDFEVRLRQRVSLPDLDGPFAEAFFAHAEAHDGPSLAAFIQRDATTEQALELLRHRSIYHLKESDPTTWVIPRLPTAPKAALMELQYDEYGRGDPNRLHSHMFELGMEASGLRPDYGAYIDDVPTEVLEQNNAMSLFGLHRRLRGAALGHLAAFEATSSLPSRRMAQGLSRLGFAQPMIDYYEEHVEADAVHEQLAVRTICASLIAEEPSTINDIMFGAVTCLDLEDRFATHLLEVWAS